MTHLGHLGNPKREISLFIFVLLAMSVLYATPRLFAGGFSAGFFKELLVDCLIMATACLPVWWLHFRKWTALPMKTRFALHLLTGMLYYAIWVILYQFYNRWMGIPLMTGRQMVQNIGPNLLFYIQVFSSLHIDLFFREREYQQNRERELRELAHRAEIESLKAQIQPHFLFNTLNSISASVPAENEHTRVLIAQLADTFRYALRSTREELVPLWQELDFLKNYLLLEQSRFGKRLEFKIVADDGCRQVSIPPMLLQPLVENAIKHGIEPAVDGGRIVITCSLEQGLIQFCIRNTGAPYTGTVEGMFNADGVGLSNTAKRLSNQFGEKLHIALDENGAVTVSFALPAGPH